MEETERVMQEVETDEVIADWSQVEEGEKFVAELGKTLKGLDTRNLEEILDLGPAGSGELSVEDLGFVLPTNLSVETVNGMNEKIRIQKGVSPETSFTSCVAAELWTRRVREVIDMKKQDTQTNEEFTQAKKEKMKIVEDMAVVLFGSKTIGRPELTNSVLEELSRRNRDNDIYRGENKALIGELLFDKGYLSDEQLNKWKARDGRGDVMLGVVRDVLFRPDTALKLDHSIANDGADVLGSRVTASETSLRNWNVGMKDFLAKDKSFKSIS